MGSRSGSESAAVFWGASGIETLGRDCNAFCVACKFKPLWLFGACFDFIIKSCLGGVAVICGAGSDCNWLTSDGVVMVCGAGFECFECNWLASDGVAMVCGRGCDCN